MLEIVPENIKVVERGKYEDVKAGEPVRARHTSVVSSGPSVLRSTLHEAPKAQLSPGLYDDSSARRTPVSYQNTISRGSPMMNRTSDGMAFVTNSDYFVTVFTSNKYKIANY
jgi:nuclear receptor co-repressor 1